MMPFINKLTKMSVCDSEMLNRVHAYLALVCLENPQFIASVNPNMFEDPSIYFNEIYDLLAEIKLALM